MALALALQFQDASRRRAVNAYKVTASGSYTTGGDTVDLTAATNPNNLPKSGWGRKPDGYRVANCPAGYVAKLVPQTSTELDDGYLLQFFESGADGGDLDEIAASTYPVGISGDTSIIIEFSGPIGL